MFTRRAMPVKAMTEQKQENIKKVMLDIYSCPNNDINKLKWAFKGKMLLKWSLREQEVIDACAVGR